MRLWQARACLERPWNPAWKLFLQRHMGHRCRTLTRDNKEKQVAWGQWKEGPQGWPHSVYPACAHKAAVGTSSGTLPHSDSGRGCLLEPAIQSCRQVRWWACSLVAERNYDALFFQFTARMSCLHTRLLSIGPSSLILRLWLYCSVLLCTCCQKSRLSFLERYYDALCRPVDQVRMRCANEPGNLPTKSRGQGKPRLAWLSPPSSTR